MSEIEITAEIMFTALEHGCWKMQPPSVKEEWIAKARALHAAIALDRWPPATPDRPD